MTLRGLIHFAAADTSQAQEKLAFFQKIYSQTSPQEADVIVVLGGDGFMLNTLHYYLTLEKPFYGIHCGTVGFLMNADPGELLKDYLQQAEATRINLLKMDACLSTGEAHTAYAINEISLLRQEGQTAKISVAINGVVRIASLACDGILVSTPAGSTAYNFSAHGPILPLGCSLLALTPINAFRPRHWRGAILPHTVNIHFTVLEEKKRPVKAMVDGQEIYDITHVRVHVDPETSVTLLFDPAHNFEERILKEQFLQD